MTLGRTLKLPRPGYSHAHHRHPSPVVCCRAVRFRSSSPLVALLLAIGGLMTENCVENPKLISQGPERKLLQVTKNHMRGILQCLTRAEKISCSQITAKLIQCSTARDQWLGAWQPSSMTWGSFSMPYIPPHKEALRHLQAQRVLSILPSMRLSARPPVSGSVQPRLHDRLPGMQGMQHQPLLPSKRSLKASGTYRHW